MDVLVAAARLLVDSGGAAQQQARRPAETHGGDAASEGYDHDRRKRPGAYAATHGAL